MCLGGGSIRTINPNGTGELEIHGTDHVHYGWSYEGTKVLLSNGNPIRVLDADGTNEVAINLASPVTQFGTLVEWSPAQMRIAYVANVSGVDEIHLVDPDGTNDIRIHFTSLEITSLVWAHSGGRLAFTTEAPSGDLYAINSDGTGLMNLTQDSSVTYGKPSWTPSDNKLVFGRDTTFHSIVADGTALTPLGGGSGRVEVSPDGSKFVFEVTSGSTGVYTRNIDGTGQERLVDDDNFLAAFSPSWSPDGLSIAYVSPLLSDMPPGEGNVWIMTAAGTAKVRVTLQDRDFQPKWRPCP